MVGSIRMKWEDRIKQLKDHRISSGDFIAFLLGLIWGVSVLDAKVDSGTATLTALVALGVYRMFIKNA